MLADWKTFSIFWSRHPGLLYGIACVLGASYALSFLPLAFLLIFVVLLILPCCFLSKNHFHYALRFALALTLCVATYALTKERHRLPEIEQLSGEGTAYFGISSVALSKIPFQKAWVYKGILHHFEPDSIQAHSATNIPLQLLVPLNDDGLRPDASHHYQLRARLKHLGENRYSLVPLKNTSWISTKKSWSLAEWRYRAKSSLSQYIQKHVHDPHVSAFLTGIATGEFNDRLLTYELSRFGLQHLMAISGLHFAIIASILGFCFRIFFSIRISAALLIVALSAYFLFLGSSPSVVRAWITILIALTALLIERQSAALNSLGLALLFIALWDPFSIHHIGFQFSFAVTASILLWFPACDDFLQKIFPKRSLSQAVRMGWLDRHGYCVLYFFRQALALGIAVNLTALPLTLFYFQKFPLLSLLYNLFFPFLISFSMLLLLLGIAMTLIMPPLGSLLHALNEAYTLFVLNFTFKLPKVFDATLYVTSLSMEVLLVYLAVIFTLGIVVQKRSRDSA